MPGTRGRRDVAEAAERSKNKPGESEAGAAARAARETRLAAELRANLARRKQQQRARRQDAGRTKTEPLDRS
jgi:hypothetical protein